MHKNTDIQQRKQFHNNIGQVVFDLNDFDGGVIADYQLDVWRLAAALIFVTQAQTGGPSMSPSSGPSRIDDMLSFYKTALQTASLDQSELRATVTLSHALASVDPLKKLLTKDTPLTRATMLDKKSWGSPRRFNITTNEINVTDEVRTGITSGISFYAQNTLTGNVTYNASHFKVKDIIQKLHSGTSSLGIDRYNIILDGPTTGEYDDIFLDVKEVPTAPALLANMEQTLRDLNTQAGSKAQLAMRSYRKLVTYADDYMGYFTYNGKSFSVREISPNKDSLNFDSGKDLKTDTLMTNLAKALGQILATAHSRADVDTDPSLISYDFDSSAFQIINSDFTGFSNLVKNIAIEMVNQTTLDFQSFQALYSAGRFDPTTAPTRSPITSSPSKSPSSSSPTSSPTFVALTNGAANNVAATVGGAVGGTLGAIAMLSVLAAVFVVQRRGAIRREMKEGEGPITVPDTNLASDGPALRV
jgi:uncharacterized protein (DUF2252 family)